MKNLVLISNCVKTKTTCELALHNTNVRLTTVSNIDHVKNDSDIVLIDETFMDKDLGMLKAYCSKIKVHPVFDLIHCLKNHRGIYKRSGT